MEYTKKIILSPEERSALEKAYRFGSCHRFRMRCKAVLMKADNVNLSDTAAVKEAVKKHRLSIRTAKAEWEKSSGKHVSDITFRRFLDLLAQDISV